MLTLTKADKFNHRHKTLDARLGKKSHKRTIPAYHKAQKQPNLGGLHYAMTFLFPSKPNFFPLKPIRFWRCW